MAKPIKSKRIEEIQDKFKWFVEKRDSIPYHAKNIVDKRWVVELVLSLMYPSVYDNSREALWYKDACQACGTTPKTVSKWRRDLPEIADAWEHANLVQTELRQLVAENVIWDVIDGTTKVKTMDRVNTAFRYLEKTSSKFQPKTQIEMKSANINFNISIEDLEKQALSIKKTYGTHNESDNQGESWEE